MTRILALGLLCFCVPVWAQDSGTASDSGPPKVDTNWPGVEMELFKIERIRGDRLLVTVCLTTNKQAPPSTLIGIPPPPLPPDAPEWMRHMILTPSPFSLKGSVMLEEQTRQKYEMLASDPHGPIYASDSIMGSLSPGQYLYLSVQFPVPPPPPEENGQASKQMVSIFLPNTKGPLLHVVVPPPAPSTSAASP